MSLKTHHTNWLKASYQDDLYFLLKVAENNPLRLNPTDPEQLEPHLDSADRLAIGYGYDLAANNFVPDGQTKTQARLDLEKAGVTVSDEAEEIIEGLTGPTTKAVRDRLADVLTLPDEATASKLLGIAINVRKAAFDNFLQRNGITLPDSRERSVLFSMWYQSPGGSGKSGYFRNENGSITNMVRALQEGNRAEVWFEIRYGSNGDQAAGIAKRRFAESEIFGVYEDASDVKAEEAKQVYRMLQAHRVKILPYEEFYAAQIAVANSEYGLSGTDEVDTLVAALDPAKESLIDWLKDQHPDLTLNPDSYVSTNIYLDPGVDAGQSFTEFDPDHGATLDARLYKEGGEHDKSNLLLGEGGDDILIGDRGADVLIGGSGNDTLVGGIGDDILLGGDGADTFYGGNQDASDDHAQDILQGGLGHDTYYVSDGDVIEDSDGEGTIDWEGVRLSGGVRLAGSVAEGQIVFKQENSNVLYESDGEELRIYNLNGSTPEIITLRSGQVGQFASLLGIELKEREPVPITGAVLHDEDKEGSVQIGGLSYDDALSFSTRDIAYQAVYGHGGSDWIRHTEGAYAGMQFYGGEGGDDIAVDALAVWEYSHNNGPAPADREGVAIYGEGGNDTLNGALGDDHIDGGEDHDVAAGALGADLLIGGAGNDWLSGDEGNDLLAGGSDNDWLVGGAGVDYLSGAGGRDRLYGDAYFSNFSVENRETGEIGAYGALHPGTYGSLKESPEAGGDILSGGAGDDFLYGGAGNGRRGQRRLARGGGR